MTGISVSEPPPETGKPPVDQSAAGKPSVRQWIAIAVVLALAIPAAIGWTRLSALVDSKLKAGPFTNSVSFYAAPRRVRADSAMPASEVIASLKRAGLSERQDDQDGWFAIRGASIEVHPVVTPGYTGGPALLDFGPKGLTKIRTLAANRFEPYYTLPPEFLTNLMSDGSRERRQLVRFEELPQDLVNAVVSVEDKRFWKHMGFDPFRIAKAIYVDLKEQRKEQGASTITMQLARGLWLEPEKAWKRKLMEVLITLQLETKLNKQQIMEHYCNQIYLGRRDTFSIHGFGEAASAFLSKDVANLTLPEAAMLAGMIQRPAYFNPFKYPERVKQRRNVVLALMKENGYVTQEQYQSAISAPIVLKPRVLDTGSAPYFLPLVQDELQARLPEREEHENTSYRVVTTLDWDLQAAAVDAVATGMKQIDKTLARRIRKLHAKPQVALVAMDPHTGQVKAVVGGRNYTESQFNHALAKRQPGSVFKPFVYAAALATATEGGNGKVFTPATTVVDEPTTFRFERQIYEPGNFGDRYYGTVTLRNALTHSMNIATIKTAEMVGYDKVAKLARAAGMNAQLQATPAMALGAYEATPLEVAGAYTIFANRGAYVKPTFLATVTSLEGQPAVNTFRPQMRQVLDRRVAFLMVNMMEDVVRRGTAASVRSKGLTMPLAGKTGTSRDGWFAGFADGLLCVVWVGFDDNSELELEGSKSALIVWTEFMKRALHHYPEAIKPFEKPEGIVAVSIDPYSGKLAGPDCPGTTEYFVAGTQPRSMCDPFFDTPFVEVTNYSPGKVAGGAIKSFFRGFRRIF